MQLTTSGRRTGQPSALLHEEVEKRYLAYALSTIVSRALPDVRDGLKPVHRRILYAMHGMRLSDAARMRKSAAVVGEVIGKYHPHGDQAAYDALVRMAQDFSLRYPLIEGSGNFGSVDGDAPAAMRYTETRLSAFAGLLLREIDQGTTEFRPTYDAMGEEPLVLPAAMPNLLLNGTSGIAVGMSCSFPPHHLGEVIAACRAVIQDRDLETTALLAHVKGPDFPTGGEVLIHPDSLTQIYASGHGSIKVRGTFETESLQRGRTNLIVTSIPYSVNKSRLIERIAQLIRDKRLKQVQDVRDESTTEVRIVLELRGGDVRPDSVMAFLYRHTDLQINFPINFIAITPQGVPDRLSLKRVIGFFLDFRYEITVLRLQHKLEILRKRIHILNGFNILFEDLDKALRIIRTARSRSEAEQGLKSHFDLDDEQVNAILEMRLYRLVGMEIGKLLDELAAKRKEAAEIARDLASSQRLWKIIDKELAEIAQKFQDRRRTRIVQETEAPAIEYDPNEFVEHEDTTVILSRQGWIRRVKTEVGDESSLKFRENDSLLGCVRVHTGRTVALFSNFGKLYVMKALDVPATTGFGEPMGSLLNLVDGECLIAIIAPDPVETRGESAAAPESAADSHEEQNGNELSQGFLFEQRQDEAAAPESVQQDQQRAVLITRRGQGFRFDYAILREVTKRTGRRLVILKKDDEVVAVQPATGDLVAIGVSTGNILVFGLEEVSILAGPGQGVRMIKIAPEASVIFMETATLADKLRIRTKRGREKSFSIRELVGKRDTKGKSMASGIMEMEKISGAGPGL
ncbi:MAG TPA: DNA topoisomerase (ATP-hydrolyzing) [Desulfomonilaceae bacterium]|nr:DNA topoisomerase (ATP-hydrolyzing) [Desulfomonilaceae bacterium]